jgi:dTDP-glucose 4,6-dehydratase
MNILVTGGCGFIGSNFILQCLSSPDGLPDNIINLDALTYAGNLSNLAGIERDRRHHFVQGSIQDESLIFQLLHDYKVAAVINFAAESHVDRSIDSPEPFIQTNVIGVLRLLNAARRYWRALPEPARSGFRFLHVSTDEVYGALSPDAPPVAENTVLAPSSPYAASKAAADHLVRAYLKTYGLPVIGTHCSNNYGPRQFPEKLIPLAILNAIEDRPIPVYGDGMQRRDWLYVEDHAAAIRLVLRKGRIGETYNIGGLNEQPNMHVVKAACALLDRKCPRPGGKSYAEQITHVADRPGHDRRYAINCEKIRRELGWQPRETFATGLERTVDWYLANRAWAGEITAKKYNRERLGAGI